MKEEERQKEKRREKIQWIASCLTLEVQPARSHGPIRFEVDDVSIHVTLQAGFQVSSNLQSTGKKERREKGEVPLKT